ncbi:MAG: hypothetical protein AB1724_18560 [Thermodesulfobacteriota bacterium]
MDFDTTGLPLKKQDRRNKAAKIAFSGPAPVLRPDKNSLMPLLFKHLTFFSQTDPQPQRKFVETPGDIGGKVGCKKVKKHYIIFQK